MTEIDRVLSRVKRVHFIGIGGSGMCPLAEILHAAGYRISGSDVNESDTLDRVRALGIPVYMGQRAENLRDAEMVVFTAALLEDNPELTAARAQGIPTFERAKLFGAVTRQYGNCIGVCGTHGKTTTTSMIVHTLLEAGLDPSALIGGKLPLTGTNGRVGSSELFVCEACEYKDTFLYLSPRCSVILNIDEDHMEYFKTLDNLRHSFTRFAEMSDTVIYNGDDENTRLAVAPATEQTKISFGLSTENDWSAGQIACRDGAYFGFDVLHKGAFAFRVQLNIPGRHNIDNALAAIAACVYAGASFEDCKRGLESFSGAGRRFETLYEKNGIRVVDDYAHHPAELRVTLDAAAHLGAERVWAVFQPFTYSRTARLMDDFAEVLSRPERCVLTEIMGSREINTFGVYASQLAEKIPGAVMPGDFDEIADYLYQNVRPGDLVLTLGCGDVYKIAKKLIKKYES